MPESFIVSRYKQCMLYAWYKNLSFINLTTYFQAKYRQLLCENRIQEFDKEIETGVSSSKLSILDAIQMTATAWDRVTTNTIKNCWIKTGILPLSYDDAETSLSELEESIQRDKCQMQHSIDNLLGNDNNVTANDFLSIDDKLLSIEDYEESTEQEIVDCVLGKNTEVETDEDAPSEVIDVSNKEAIECLEKLQKYINQENNMSVSFEWMRQFNSIKNSILNNIMSKKVQTQLEQYFDFNLNN